MSVYFYDPKSDKLDAINEIKIDPEKPDEMLYILKDVETGVEVIQTLYKQWFLKNLIVQAFCGWFLGHSFWNLKINTDASIKNRHLLHKPYWNRATLSKDYTHQKSFKSLGLCPPNRCEVDLSN